MLCSDAVIWGWLIHSTQCLLSSYISTQTPFVATLHCSLKTSLPIDQQLCVSLQFCWAWAQQEQEREASMHRHRSECHMHQQRHRLAAGCIATMGSTCTWARNWSVRRCLCLWSRPILHAAACSIDRVHACIMAGPVPCLSFSNCGTHTHTGIEEAAGKRARAHTQTRECTAQR